MKFNEFYKKASNFLDCAELTKKAYIYDGKVCLLKGYGETFIGWHKYITLTYMYSDWRGPEDKEIRVYEYQWDNVKIVDVEVNGK
jgi:hypothetical protein